MAREDRGERKMYKAVCANCGKECEVPFEPKPDRPVYCNDCFSKMKSSSRDKKGGNRNQNDNQRRNIGDPGLASRLDSVNSKLDRILNILQPQTSNVESPKKEEKVSEVKPEEPKEEKPKKVRKTAAKKTKKEEKSE